jgi:hypothetical protein
MTFKMMKPMSFFRMVFSEICETQRTGSAQSTASPKIVLCLRRCLSRLYLLQDLTRSHAPASQPLS